MLDVASKAEDMQLAPIVPQLGAIAVASANVSPAGLRVTFFLESDHN